MDGKALDTGNVCGRQLWIDLVFNKEASGRVFSSQPKDYLELGGRLTEVGFNYRVTGLFDWKYYGKFFPNVDFRNEHEAFAHFYFLGADAGASPGCWFDVSYIRRSYPSLSHENFGSLFQFLEALLVQDISPSTLLDFGVVRRSVAARSDLRSRYPINETTSAYEILRLLADPDVPVLPATSPYFWTRWIIGRAKSGLGSSLGVAVACASASVGAGDWRPNPWFDAAWVAAQSGGSYRDQGEVLAKYVADLQYRWARPNCDVDILFEAKRAGLDLKEARRVGPYRLLMVKRFAAALTGGGQADEASSVLPARIRAEIDRQYYYRRHEDALARDRRELGVRRIPDHYIAVGAGLGFSPAPWFNETSYLTLHGDVRAAVQAGNFISGFAHYVTYGRDENRRLTLCHAQPSTVAAVRLIEIRGEPDRGVEVTIRIARNAPEMSIGNHHSSGDGAFTRQRFEDGAALLRFIVSAFGQSGPTIVVAVRESVTNDVEGPVDVDLASLAHPDLIQCGRRLIHGTSLSPLGRLEAGRLATLLGDTNVLAFRADAVAA